jgi:hypothetical protein
MRSRLLAPALAALALLVAAPAALAAPSIGISENQSAMFNDPLFTSLGVKRVRLVASYDVIARGGHELQRVTEYLNAARAQNVDVLVSFEHSRGDATRCNVKRNRNKRVCKLPTTSQYRAALTSFFRTFPWVKTVSPWNEINHFTQPTSRNARRAAQFTDVARQVCGRGCTIVALDVLDQADSVASKRPTFRRVSAYIRSVRRYLKTPRKVCGIHNYSDTNRFRDAGTRALTKALGCKQIWLTETGGIYKFGRSFPASSSRQLRATKYLFNTLVRRNKKVKRVYVYTWFGGVTSRFDAGLVAKGKPRPALREVRKHLR